MQYEPIIERHQYKHLLASQASCTSASYSIEFHQKAKQSNALQCINRKFDSAIAVKWICQNSGASSLWLLAPERLHHLQTLSCLLVVRLYCQHLTAVCYCPLKPPQCLPAHRMEVASSHAGPVLSNLLVIKIMIIYGRHLAIQPAPGLTCESASMYYQISFFLIGCMQCTSLAM